MRLPVILLTVTLAACSSGKKKVAPHKKASFTEVMGTWTDNNYKNTFFDVQLALSEDWEVEKKKFRTKLSPTLVEAFYYEKRSDQLPLIALNISADRANPFELQHSITKQHDETIEAFEFLYDDQDILKTPYTKTKIGGKKYVLNRIGLIDELDTSYVDDYTTFYKGYYLTITLSYNSALTRNMADSIVKSIDGL